MHTQRERKIHTNTHKLQQRKNFDTSMSSHFFSIIYYSSKLAEVIHTVSESEKEGERVMHFRLVAPKLLPETRFSSAIASQFRNFITSLSAESSVSKGNISFFFTPRSLLAIGAILA